MSSQECIQIMDLRCPKMVVNPLPVEIIIVIVSLTSCPSAEHPYPYIRFSGVCRDWRFAVLGYPAFWRTIAFNRRLTPDFLQEIIRRSQTAPLEVIAQDGMRSVHGFWSGLSPVADRVKTLHIHTLFPRHRYLLRFADLTSYFPSLENLFFETSQTIDKSFEEFVDPQLHVKALQLNISYEQLWRSHKLPRRFPGLRWLKFRFEGGNMYDMIKNLPDARNLQILHLHSDGYTWCDGFRKTLGELRVLLTEHSTPRLINAPKLTYLEINEYKFLKYGENVHLCRFNFSGITHICFNISDMTNFRIMGRNDSGAGFSFCHDNHIESILNPISTFYPNEFNISLENLTHHDFFDDLTVMGPRRAFPLFRMCLKETVNLVGIILDRSYSGIAERPWNHDELEYFFTAIKVATSVRELTVKSFATLCDFLGDGTLFPLLEKLTYSNNVDKSQSLADLHLLENLMMERGPLEVILEDFPIVQSKLLEQIGSLRIRLIQTTSGDVVSKN